MSKRLLIKYLPFDYGYKVAKKTRVPQWADATHSAVKRAGCWLIRTGNFTLRFLAACAVTYGVYKGLQPRPHQGFYSRAVLLHPHPSASDAGRSRRCQGQSQGRGHWLSTLPRRPAESCWPAFVSATDKKHPVLLYLQRHSGAQPGQVSCHALVQELTALARRAGGENSLHESGKA